MRLLLISLDGLWEKDISSLEKLPYIGALIRRGTICTNVQTVYPALTYPAHATILTGCLPKDHGIAHNQPFTPSIPPERKPWYWDADDIKKPTIHQLVHDHGGKVASILWPVTGKSKYIRWNFPEVLALPGENQTLKMLRYGTAPWIINTELKYGRQRKSIHQPDLDDYATILAASLLQSRRPPELLTLHLVDCDEMRHHHGVNSFEAMEAIRRLDRRVGLVLTALDKMRLGKETIVAIVSDHGLADINEYVSLDQAIAKAGFAHVCRTQSSGMGAYIHFLKDAQKYCGSVRRFLEENQKMLRIDGVYGAAELAQMGAGRDIYLAVEAAPGVAFMDGYANEKHEMATHGFGPWHPAAKCLFMIAGPGIQQGVRLVTANMEDIAPTLMHAIGYRMDGTQGKILTESFEKS